jgi:hypothetical protein
MKKISLKDEHIQPALTAGVTIDPIFSIGIALRGGVIWNLFGFQCVFLLGIIIAGLNFVAASRIRPRRPVAAEKEIPIPISIEGI